jgi:hypothetical protein
MMTIINGPPSVPARSLSNLWLSADLRISGGFYLAFMLMKAKRIMIPGGSFQVQWKSLT